MEKEIKEEKTFDYTVEQFADLQLLRYVVHGFEDLSLEQKELVYYLSQAALEGRDILFDQNGKYNLVIRRMLETVYTDYQGNRADADFVNLEIYLKRVWFSNGIHHHYASDKFVPAFTPEFFRTALKNVDAAKLPLADGETVDTLCDRIFPVIFDPKVMSKRVNQAETGFADVARRQRAIQAVAIKSLCLIADRRFGHDQAAAAGIKFVVAAPREPAQAHFVGEAQHGIVG